MGYNMKQSIENALLSRIYGHGRGWVFSQKDFAMLGRRSAIHVALHRMVEKGKIRRVIRGLYDYPKYSSLLNQELSPDIDQVARALARKFRWSIQPTGPAALNLMGISTQVPGRHVYLSTGPNRSYEIGTTTLNFQHTVAKDAAFELSESALIVHGLKSLGINGITPQVIGAIRNWLDPALRTRVLKDTRTVTGWMYSAIRRICADESKETNQPGGNNGSEQKKLEDKNYSK